MEIIASHAIVDVMSFNIIKTHIHDYYNAILNKQTLNYDVLPYSEYVQQILRNSRTITSLQMQDVFKINEFCKQVDESDQRIVQEFVNTHKKLDKNEKKNFFSHYDIDFKLIGDEHVWDISFNLYCRLMSKLFGTTELPIFLLSYGRRYGNHSYFNTVGEFLDLLPLYIKYNPNDPLKIMDEVIGKISFARKHSLNVLNTLLASNGADNGWQDINNKFRAIFGTRKFSCNIFNFAEKFTAEDFKSFIENADLYFQTQTNTSYFECSVRYTNDVLRFIISSPFYVDDKLFSEAFDTNFMQEIKSKLVSAQNVGTY